MAIAYTNPRGEYLLDAFVMLAVVLLNRGKKDTFTRNGRCYKIDMTFVSDSLATLSDWTLSDICMHNNHTGKRAPIGTRLLGELVIRW